MSMKPTAAGHRLATEPRWRARGRRVLVVLVAVMAGSISITSAGTLGLLLTRKKIDLCRPGLLECPRGDERTQPSPGGGGPDQVELPEEPINVIIVGSDTREGLSDEEKEVAGTVEGRRSDTLILLHLDPRREKAVMLHFPRDLLVDIPGHGENRINTAYNEGGGELVIRTIRRLTRIPLDHYVEVDFVGFRKLVDALGGVRICVDRRLVDRLAFLDLPAGCHRMDGNTALAFVRARHVEGDNIPDFARIARQQQFIRAVLNEIVALRNPIRIPGVVMAAFRAFTTDTQLSTQNMVQLSRELARMAGQDPTETAAAMDLRVVPSVPGEYGDASVVTLVQPDADELFRRIREGEPLGDLGTVQAETAPSPAVIRVRILERGHARKVERARRVLLRGGFVYLGEMRANRRLRGTQVLYRPGEEDKAEVVASLFGVRMEEGPRRLLEGVDVALFVGRNFRGVGEG
ncbi:MAG: LCP family protein [Actinomycetota bacterium]|nr:LCP family protein [Actinomycetota bacterium]